MTKRRIFIATAISLFVFTFLVIFSFHSIYQNVSDISIEAKNEFGLDTVESLMAVIKSKRSSFKEKNNAIFALGQIGDKRALPILIQLDTDEIQEKPWDSSKYIVQYKVEKATEQVNSSFSLTRWMYNCL